MTRLLPDELQTSRLRLRPPLESDARAIFDAYTHDPQVTRYLTWRPHRQLSEATAFISKCRDAWRSGERQPYVLTLNGDDSPIGMLDARFRSHIVEFGYVLARPYWGSGLMPEAVAALAQASLALTNVYRVQAMCDVENIASARTLEKAGFVRDGVLPRYIIHPNASEEPRACFMYSRCR